MIEEQALVVEVGQGLAQVETRRRSACGGCSASSGCGTAVVARLFGERSNRLQLSDTLGVAVGDRVVIGVSDGTLTRASLLAYVAPLLALMAAAIAARSTGAVEGVQALAGMLGLCLGLWLAGRLTCGAAGRERLHPVLLRRIDTRGPHRRLNPCSGGSGSLPAERKQEVIRR